MASRRLQEFREETARRRTARGQQRSEMMEQRRQGAQTAYMARMGERVGGQAGAAIGMGETQRQYVTAQDQLRSAEAQRQLARDTGAGLRMQGEGALETGRAAYLGAEQAPAMQTEQIAGDLARTKAEQAGGLAIERQRGETDIRSGQLGVVAARTEAQAQRDAARHLAQMQLQAQREQIGAAVQPIPHGDGAMRWSPGEGRYVYHPFPFAGHVNEAGQVYTGEGKPGDESWFMGSQGGR